MSGPDEQQTEMCAVRVVRCLANKSARTYHHKIYNIQHDGIQWCYFEKMSLKNFFFSQWSHWLEGVYVLEKSFVLPFDHIN